MYENHIHNREYERADELLHESILGTRTGNKLFSKSSQVASSGRNANTVLGNLQNVLVEQMGQRSKHRSQLVARVSEGLPTKWFAETLGVKASYVRHAKKLKLDNLETPLLTEGRTEGAGRQSFPLALEQEIKAFFYRNTSIFSGASSETRKLTITKTRLEALLEAEWPSMLRTVLARDPSLLPKSADGVKTKLQREFLLCQADAKEDNFDEVDEYQRRLEKKERENSEDLMYQSLRKAGLSPEKPDRIPNEISAMGRATFWKTIASLKIKYSTCLKPHSCPLHDEGPVWELRQAQILEKLASCDAGDPARARLEKESRKLATDIRRYRRHLDQFASARRKVKEMEESLIHGDKRCVVYRDYVNVHNENGTKVLNLVLTKITRGADGQLEVKTLNNFSADKNTAGADAFFTADVMDHHLKGKGAGGSGCFDDVHTIYQSGDHGPHFACTDTVYNESTFYKRYEKKLRNMFLCSYHAYNRCDGQYKPNNPYPDTSEHP